MVLETMDYQNLTKVKSLKQYSLHGTKQSRCVLRIALSDIANSQSRISLSKMLRTSSIPLRPSLNSRKKIPSAFKAIPTRVNCITPLNSCQLSISTVLPFQRLERSLEMVLKKVPEKMSRRETNLPNLLTLPFLKASPLVHGVPKTNLLPL